MPLFSLQADASFDAERRRMVETQLRPRGVRDERVLDAMLQVPRHEFVPQEFREQAYEDHPIPIGFGQTISQPLIVARMLEALALSGIESVLEVGTGSGYVAALLSRLAANVISLERHSELASQAAALLARLGYGNVRVVAADGTLGFPEAAPYHAILVSAAAPGIPPALFSQLRENGRMAIPVGPDFLQDLLLVTRREGKPDIRSLEGCRFVPLLPGAP